jgi:hypothetical protein
VTAQEEQDAWEAHMKVKFPKVLGPPHPWPSLQIGVGKGWRLILEGLVTKLEALDDPPKAIQIKEKFGELRFYVSGNLTTEAQEAISAASRASTCTCESCGAPGESTSVRGWVKTLCEGCKTEALNRRR